MKEMPENLPPLPKGAVYLGKGKELKRLQYGRRFDGWAADGDSTAWHKWDWLGGGDDIYYAAPAESQIARLNELGGEPKEKLIYVAGYGRITRAQAVKELDRHLDLAIAFARALKGISQ